MQTAQVKAQAMEGLLLMGILSALVVVGVPMIGAKINAMLEPLRAVLG